MRFLLFSFVFTIVFGSPINYDPYGLYSDAFTIDPDQVEQPNMPETQTPNQISVALGNEDPTIQTVDSSLATQTDPIPDVTGEEFSQVPTQPDSTSSIAKNAKPGACLKLINGIEIPCAVLMDIPPMMLTTFFAVKLWNYIEKRIEKRKLDNREKEEDAELARDFEEAVEKAKLKRKEIREQVAQEPADEDIQDPDAENFKKYIKFLDTNDHAWLQTNVEESLVESGQARRGEGLTKLATLVIAALVDAGPWLILLGV